MSYISDKELNEIREKANIVEIIGEYLELHQAGNNYKAVCPFHDDHDPSLSVSPDKQIYKCFVCGQAGDVFGFVRDYEHVSFQQAVKIVADKVGYSLNIKEGANTEDKYIKQYQLINEAQKFMEYTFKQQKEGLLSNFISARELTPELIDTFKLGYIDRQFPLTSYLTKKGYSESMIESINLGKITSEGLQDIFVNRVLFPIADENGQIVAYTARALGNSQPKYINSATTDIYQKSKILYNYHIAKNPLYKKDTLVICEGVMDVIAFYKAGHQKVVATLGTALSDYQIQLIKKLNCPIVLAYDGDKAGLKAAYTIGKSLKAHQINVSIYNNNSSKDPDEIVKEHSKETLIEMIESPKHWMDFILSYASDLYGLTSYDSKRRVVSFALNELKSFDSMDQLYYVDKIQELTGLSKELIVLDKTMTTRVKPEKKEVVKKDGLLLSEKQIIAHLLEGPKYTSQFKEECGYLLNPQAQNIALTLMMYYSSHETFDLDIFKTMMKDEESIKIVESILSNSMFMYPKSSQSLSENIKVFKIMDIDILLDNILKELHHSTDNQHKTKLLTQKIQLEIQRKQLKEDLV